METEEVEETEEAVETVEVVETTTTVEAAAVRDTAEAPSHSSERRRWLRSPRERQARTASLPNE